MTLPAPVLTWQELAIWPSENVQTFEWRAQYPGQVPPSVPISLAAGQRLWAFVTCSGTAPSVTFTGTVVENSQDIIDVSGTTGLYPGMAVQGDGLQNDCTIIQIGLPGAGGEVIVSGVGLVSQSGVEFTATDPAPTGTFAISVSPSTGVTIEDQNFDGSSASPPVGTNGQLVCNWDGEAEGTFTIEFPSAGTYTVSAAFTSGDTNYANAAAAPLTVVVS